MEKRNSKPREKEFNESVISVNRVTKVTKGGRNLRFAATVVVGDGKGKVGLGTGKANEVQDAIKKAIGNATNNMIKIDLVEDRTVSHDAIGSSGAANRSVRHFSDSVQRFPCQTLSLSSFICRNVTSSFFSQS